MVTTYYEYGDKIGEHTDTRHAPDEQCANLDGAAIFSAWVGMPMELWTRKFLSRPGQKEKMHSYQYEAAKLTSGGAFCWDAGAEGSDDWRVKHSVWPGPEAQPGEMRIAFVFRAMKPEYAREYSVRWPYRAVSYDS